MKIFERLDDNLQMRIEDALRLLTPEEIETWNKHPATQYILARIEQNVLNLNISWSSGSFTEEAESGTIQRNAEALGEVAAFTAIEDDIISLAEVRASLEVDNEEED